jgi:hypothetical protein
MADIKTYKECFNLEDHKMSLIALESTEILPQRGDEVFINGRLLKIELAKRVPRCGQAVVLWQRIFKCADCDAICEHDKIWFGGCFDDGAVGWTCPKCGKGNRTKIH